MKMVKGTRGAAACGGVSASPRALIPPAISRNRTVLGMGILPRDIARPAGVLRGIRGDSSPLDPCLGAYTSRRRAHPFVSPLPVFASRVGERDLMHLFVAALL